MIALARAEAQLARSADEVFAYVADLRHFGGWFPGFWRSRPGTRVESRGLMRCIGKRCACHCAVRPR